MGVSNVFRGWFTGTNNESYELARALWAICVLAMICYQGYAIFKGQTFHPESFGIGMAGILAAGGAGVALKDRAHPKHKPTGGENDPTYVPLS